MNQEASYVDPADSSATMMRATAAALRGTWMQPQEWPEYLVRLAGPGNHLPAATRARAVTELVRTKGIDPAWAGRITADGLAQWVVDLYEKDAPPGEQYDAVVLGAPGGGTAHLAALLRAPFLSQTFVTRYRYRGHPDDTAAYQAYGARLAEPLLARNPNLVVVNHYDPVHDRLQLPYVNYVRMKLLDLPRPYAAFIERHLRPGGTLLLIDCQYPWGQYRIARRHYFQVGGLGGIADTEYVQGSPQVDRFLAAHGRRDQHSWSLPHPLLGGMESEWATQPPFQGAVEEFAAERGYRYRALRGTHPEDFSRMAFYASYQAALSAALEPAGVLVDCFTQTSPTAALRAGLLPLWLPFNCTDSLEFLRQMARNFPHGKPILLAPMPSFCPAWDTVAAGDWQAACGPEAHVTWIGANPQVYPVDLAALFRFVPDLQAWCGRITQSMATALRDRARPPFSVADLEALVASMAAQEAAESQAGRNIAETPAT